VCGQANLLIIIDALGTLGLLLGGGQRGQKQRRQDGDDRDNYQQFDEGEAGTGCGPSPDRV
jgi:hypothetical protein